MLNWSVAESSVGSNMTVSSTSQLERRGALDEHATQKNDMQLKDATRAQFMSKFCLKLSVKSNEIESNVLNAETGETREAILFTRVEYVGLRSSSVRKGSTVTKNFSQMGNH